MYCLVRISNVQAPCGHLGLLYRELSEMDQARMALNTASQLDPNNLQIQSVLLSLPGSTSK